MSTENIKENAVIKFIREIIVPDINEIKTNVSILKSDMAHLESELKSDIAHLDDKVDLIKSELKSDIAHLDDKIDSLDKKVDTKITALSEKVDYMNKFNERLFDIIHPTAQK